MVDPNILSKINPRVHKLQSNSKFVPCLDTSGQGPPLERSGIKLLTYNLFARPMVKNNENDWKDERIAEFAQRLDEFDIICNQEIFDFLNNKRRPKFIAYAQKAGFPYYCHSDPPPLFSNFLIDGGLLTLSRFPIIKKEFRPYNFGISSDAMTQKGCLYSLIDINGRYLHLFQTHTQASYLNETPFEFEGTLATRKDQFHTIRSFIEQKTKDITPNQLIILCGDLNVNGRKEDPSECKIRKALSGQPEFLPALDEFDIEYRTVMNILSKNGEDQVIDLMRDLGQGVSPITFADATQKEDGSEEPCEVEMTSKDDLCTKQCLDYILEIRRGFCLKKQEDEGEQDTLVDKNLSNIDNENQVLGLAKLEVVKEESKVEKFEWTNGPCQVKQLSDHYGISTVLNAL